MSSRFSAIGAGAEKYGITLAQRKIGALFDAFAKLVRKNSVEMEEPSASRTAHMKMKFTVLSSDYLIYEAAAVSSNESFNSAFFNEASHKPVHRAFPYGTSVIAFSFYLFRKLFDRI